MTDLSVRVPDDLAEALERRAVANGRSIEAEHRAILQEVVTSPFDPSGAQAKARWIERARKLREETQGRTFTPSEVLIRETRDER